MNDEIEVVLYQYGVPVLKAIAKEINIESNVEEVYGIERDENGELQCITTRPESPPLKMKFEGTVIDMDLFDKLTKPKEGV